MPKISKKFLTIWAPVLLMFVLIVALSLIGLYYSLKVSDGIGLNTKKVSVAAGENIFYKLGCVRCHNIKVLGIKGGHVGPDLSGAYSDVEKVYRENVNNFLKYPSGTMYFVLMFNKLSKEDRKTITEELKKAQEIKNKTEK